MEEMKYESPKLSFRALKLTENIAATCWGYAYAWYDADGDGTIDSGEKVDLVSLGLGSSGCQGSSARDALKAYFYNNFGVSLTDDQVSTNTNSSVVSGSNS